MTSLWGNDKVNHEVIYEVILCKILCKIYSVQEMFLEHKNLA